MRSDQNRLNSGRFSERSLSNISQWESLIKNNLDEAGISLPDDRQKKNWNPPYCGEIDIVIGADGAWFYQGSPITRPALVRLFASVLRREDDDVYYLVTPVEKFSIKVDDAPFLAVDLKVAEQGNHSRQKLFVRTNVDVIICVGQAHPLRFVGDPARDGLKPYVYLRDGLEALASRPLYYDLVELAVEEFVGDDKNIGIWSSGVFFPMAPADFGAYR